MAVWQDHIKPGDFKRTLRSRTITLELGQPWLLGWCRWAITTTYYAGDVKRVETLARGRWKWRGRRAKHFVGVLACDQYWR